VINAGLGEDRAVDSHEGKVTVITWTVVSMKKRTEFEHLFFLGLILISAFGGLIYRRRLVIKRRNFNVDIRENCMRSMKCNKKCNVEFGCKLSN
jgi:hypothetical protein